MSEVTAPADRDRLLAAALADWKVFQEAIQEKLPVATVLIAAGFAPEDSTTRFMPFLTTEVKGKEGEPSFFGAAVASRDLILALIALNKQFGLGLDAALDLLSMTHPMVHEAMQKGSLHADRAGPGERPRRVVRDVVEVTANGNVK